MKISWGTGIAIVYGIFVVGMLGAVMASTTRKPVMVSKDYYDLDLKYQEHYDKKTNAAQLPDGLPIQFEAATQRIKIDFPEDLGTPGGKVKLFRSVTTANDQLINIEPDDSGDFYISVEGFPKGIWNIEVDWTAGDKAYFNESKIYI